MRDEPPAMTVGRNIGKGWMTGHGAVPSPASSGGLEDDHSQRLCVLFLCPSCFTLFFAFLLEDG